MSKRWSSITGRFVFQLPIKSKSTKDAGCIVVMHGMQVQFQHGLKGHLAKKKTILKSVEDRASDQCLVYNNYDYSLIFIQLLSLSYQLDNQSTSFLQTIDNFPDTQSHLKVWIQNAEAHKHLQNDFTLLCKINSKNMPTFQQKHYKPSSSMH